MNTLVKFIIPVLLLLPLLNARSQNLLNGPDDIVFDEMNSRYLVGNWAGNRIVSIDSNGNQAVFMIGLPLCHGMELFGDTLYVASSDKIYGININSAQITKSITVPGSSRLGHITVDTLTNILYVSDWLEEKVFKVNLCTNVSSILVNTGLESPVGVLYDENHNRIVLLSFALGVPIKAIDPVNGQVSNITSTNYDYLDAIARDKHGFIYVSSFYQGLIQRFDSAFSSPPVTLSTGHNGPSGLGYNKRDHILGVTNYNSNSISLIHLPVISVNNESEQIVSFSLHQNYPNPFNPVTRIKFDIPPSPRGEGGRGVRLVIYDLLGRLVATLVNEKLQPGSYEVEWPAPTGDGSTYASGVYFYSLITSELTETKKLILLK